MAPRKRAPCQLCNAAESKYACPRCAVLYCSVACFKRHKAEISCDGTRSNDPGPGPVPPQPTPEASTTPAQPPAPPADAPLGSPPTLKSLKDLRWPYVPETSAYPDPLTRDDPKALTLAQYEAIATSPAIRTALASPRIPALLTALDALRGPAREHALHRALGVAPPGAIGYEDGAGIGYEDGNMEALRTFAEAVEGAVRGDKDGTLGLDWGDA